MYIPSVPIKIAWYICIGAVFHPDLSHITGGHSEVRVQVLERGQKLPRGGNTRKRRDNVMDIRKVKGELITSVRCRDGNCARAPISTACFSTHLRNVHHTIDQTKNETDGQDIVSIVQPSDNCCSRLNQYIG